MDPPMTISADGLVRVGGQGVALVEAPHLEGHAEVGEVEGDVRRRVVGFVLQNDDRSHECPPCRSF